MSYTAEELVKIAANYEQLAAKSLVISAKTKEKKKLNPKAKVRNRGTVCVSAEQAKDKKDHFPINDEGQARNALARVQQLSSAPWYKGSLEGLKALVARKVKAKYPKIDVGGKKEKKSSINVSDAMIKKYAQFPGAEYVPGIQKSLFEGQNQSVQPRMPVPQNFSPNPNMTAPGQQNQPNSSTMIGPPAAGTRPAAQTRAPNPYREDVHSAQQKLNSLIMSGAISAHPLDPDGKIGPLTRAVLKAYKDQYLKIPHLTDEETIQAVNRPRES